MPGVQTHASGSTERGRWPSLFSAAFTQSRNAMLLLDEQRRVVDVNGACIKLLGYRREQLLRRPVYDIVVGGPLATTAEWQRELAHGHFTGEAELLGADGSRIAIQWAATSEQVTGQRLVLFVALSTSRWGRRFRREQTADEASAPLSRREREIVALVALGQTGPEIADELRISHDTVRTHARNAMTKVGARSRAHLVAKALAEGLIFD